MEPGKVEILEAKNEPGVWIVSNVGLGNDCDFWFSAQFTGTLAEKCAKEYFDWLNTRTNRDEELIDGD